MKSRKIKFNIFDQFINFFMIIVVFITVYPFYYSLILSLNNGYDTYLGNLFLWPRAFTWANYEIVFINPNIVSAFIVTISRTVIGSIASVFFTASVAYGLSKKDLMFRKTYLSLGLITMYFSGGLIPFYFVLKELKLLNTFAVFIIPALLSFYYVILFISFFRTVPESLRESARIDGANEAFIYIRIVLPLCVPIIATIALFNGVGQWNSWFDAQFFTTDPKFRTLQLVLMQIIARTAGQLQLSAQLGIELANPKYTMESIRYATMMVAIGPIVFIYPFLQRYFIKGIMVGSLKG